MQHSNGMGPADKLASLDARLSLVESSVVGIRDALDTRIDALVQAMGDAPNAVLGTPGRGLLGAVASLVEAEHARARDELARERRWLSWERRRAWASAVVALVAGVCASLYYAGVTRH